MADDVPIPKCEDCWNDRKEYVEFRDMSEHLELNVFLLEELQTPGGMGKMYHKLAVILRGWCILCFIQIYLTEFN